MKSEKVYIEYLLLKAQQGDQQAADDLLAVLQSKIRAFVLKILGASAALDDCVQESLLKVHRKLKQLKAVKAVHTWVYRIVYSTCMDHLRALDNHGEVPDVGCEPVLLLDQQLDVKAAIAQLPEEQQAIIHMFYYEGFTVTEVAQIMEKPAGTVKYLLFAARDQIKSSLTIRGNQS